MQSVGKVISLSQGENMRQEEDRRRMGLSGGGCEAGGGQCGGRRM